MRLPVLVLTCIAVFATACTEGTGIRTSPSGAKVYINDQLIGISPVNYYAPVDEMDRDFRVRIEREGYQPEVGELNKDFCRGRVAAGIFTLGIFFLFKDFDCFKGIYQFVLKPDEAAGGVGTALNLDKRLERIDRLRQQGTITEEEFRRYREEILKDL